MSGATLNTIQTCELDPCLEKARNLVGSMQKDFNPIDTPSYDRALMIVNKNLREKVEELTKRLDTENVQKLEKENTELFAANTDFEIENQKLTDENQTLRAENAALKGKIATMKKTAFTVGSAALTAVLAVSFLFFKNCL